MQLAVRGLINKKTVRQRQARAFGWVEIDRFLKTAGESLPATRERALHCIAYDTMARRSDLVGLSLKEFQLLSGGTGRVFIRRSKTDHAEEGAASYMSRTTARHFKRCLDVAEIRDGAVFRRIVGRGTATTDADGRGLIGERLSAGAIAGGFKRLARWIGMPGSRSRR